jgi:hypothetical protein
VAASHGGLSENQITYSFTDNSLIFIIVVPGWHGNLAVSDAFNLFTEKVTTLDPLPVVAAIQSSAQWLQIIDSPLALFSREWPLFLSWQ